MKFDDVIKERKSVRSFKSKKVSWKDILEAIDCANQAPFASNLNNLKYLIIEDQDKIEKIAELADQLWINEAQILVVAVSDEKKITNMHPDIGARYSAQQSGAAIENFLLKITDLGLSSCWVGSFDEKEIKRLLKISPSMTIEALLPVGYEKGDTARKKKAALENTIYWEEWDKTRREDLFKEPRERYSMDKSN